MAVITFESQRFECAPGQSVLDCLNRAGMRVPWGCGAGACQACLMRAFRGEVDPRAQAGLSATRAAQGYFLACQWRPPADVEVGFGDPPAAPLPAHVTGIAPLTSGIVRLRLRAPAGFEYRPGQFLRLHRGAASRCYSLASVPALDPELELHVRRVPGGEFSAWIHDGLAAGDEVAVSAACGESFYVAQRQTQGLCLIGTGSGLAPLYGIARDALRQGHTGPVWLFHGASEPAGLYMREELGELQRRHSNFKHVACVSGAESPGLAHGRAHTVALASLQDLSGWSVYLCGHPAMVEAARRASFLAGAALRDIHSDPFLPSAPRTTRLVA